LLTEVQQEESAEPLEIAAALAGLLQGDEPLLLSEKAHKPPRENRGGQGALKDEKRAPRRNKTAGSDRALPLKGHPEVEMLRFRLEVGHRHDVKPGNIVGAIANEAELDSEYIGHIEIYEDYSTVDLPAGMPKETFFALKKARVSQHRLDISVVGAEQPAGRKRKPLSFKSKKKSKTKTKTGAKSKGKPGEREPSKAKFKKKVAKKKRTSKH